MTYAKRQKQALEEMPHCNSQFVACRDQLPSAETMRLTCEHVYCNNCIKKLFSLSTKDQSRFPPVCCHVEIGLQLVRPIMSQEELDAFREAKIEFATTDRTYCSNLQCGKFIPPIQVFQADCATCDHCGTRTYVHCKGALQATLALAKELGWQRCRVCKTIVELKHGCYHMTYAVLDKFSFKPMVTNITLL
jgi:hypothetical protein